MELVSGAFWEAWQPRLVPAVPQTLPLGSPLLGHCFFCCLLAEEKTCKINMAGELPRGAGWQLTVPGGPSPKYLLVEFAGSCCVFAALGGGFLLADAYKKRSGA